MFPAIKLSTLTYDTVFDITHDSIKNIESCATAEQRKVAKETYQLKPLDVARPS